MLRTYHGAVFFASLLFTNNFLTCLPQENTSGWISKGPILPDAEWNSSLLVSCLLPPTYSISSMGEIVLEALRLMLAAEINLARLLSGMDIKPAQCYVMYQRALEFSLYFSFMLLVQFSTIEFNFIVPEGKFVLDNSATAYINLAEYMRQGIHVWEYPRDGTTVAWCCDSTHTRRGAERLGQRPWSAG